MTRKTQLDRIEQKLDMVLEHLGLTPKKRPRQKGDPSHTKGRRLHKWSTSWVQYKGQGPGTHLEWTCVREGCNQKKYHQDEKVPDCQAPKDP